MPLILSTLHHNMQQHRARAVILLMRVIEKQGGARNPLFPISNSLYHLHHIFQSKGYGLSIYLLQRSVHVLDLLSAAFTQPPIWVWIGLNTLTLFFIFIKSSYPFLTRTLGQSNHYRWRLLHGNCKHSSGDYKSKRLGTMTMGMMGSL